MARQLNLNRDQLDQCYLSAKESILHASKFIQRHSTNSIESASLLLAGVEGEHRGISLASLIVNQLTKDQLRLGAIYWWGRALIGLKQEPKELALTLARGKIKWEELPKISPAEIRQRTRALAKEGLKKMPEGRKSDPFFPFLLQIDVAKPKHIPSLTKHWSEKKEWQSVVRWQRKEDPKLFDQSSFEEFLKHFKSSAFVPALGGVSLPEQLVLALKNGLHLFCLDGFTPILKNEIDMRRSLVDFSFTLALSGRYSVSLFSDHWRLQNTSNNPLKVPQVFASLLLFEQLAKLKGVALDALSFSFPWDALTEVKEDLASQIALAQIFREMFTQQKLILHLPPHLDPLYFFVAAFTGQDILAWHFDEKNSLFRTPHLTKEIQKLLKRVDGFENELSVNTYGRIARQSHIFLEQIWKLLRKMEHLTFWKALESSLLADLSVKSSLGSEGVFQKSYHYWNPVLELLEKTPLGEEN